MIFHHSSFNVSYNELNEIKTHNIAKVRAHTISTIANQLCYNSY